MLSLLRTQTEQQKCCRRNATNRRQKQSESGVTRSPGTPNVSPLRLSLSPTCCVLTRTKVFPLNVDYCGLLSVPKLVTPGGSLSGFSKLFRLVTMVKAVRLQTSERASVVKLVRFLAFSKWKATERSLSFRQKLFRNSAFV